MNRHRTNCLLAMAAFGVTVLLPLGCGGGATEGAIQSDEQEWLDSASEAELSRYAEQPEQYPFMSFEERELVEELGANPLQFPPDSEDRRELERIAEEMRQTGLDAEEILEEYGFL